MLWFWFIIGFIMTICGAVLFSYNDYIEICGLDFDAEDLGVCMMITGGVLAGVMLFGLGIGWMVTVEGGL